MFVLGSSSYLNLPTQQSDQGWSGALSLDMELLKQYRVSAIATIANQCYQLPVVQDQVWLEYAYCKLQYLSTKLAEGIGKNKQDKLGFPNKQDPTKWMTLMSWMTFYTGIWCLTEMSVCCTLLEALNGSASSAEEWCKPIVTPATCQKVSFTIWSIRYIITCFNMEV